MKQEILKHCQHPWAELVQAHEVLDSTNLQAKELARQGAPEGTCVIAQGQTAGRGRLGRSFHSPLGQGLYLSLILRPECSPTQLMHLTCAAALAACDAIERSCGYRPGIKWINDLIWGSQKLGGILTELSIGQNGTVDWAVVGIGINCKQSQLPQELQGLACSLEEITGEIPDQALLAAELIQALAQMRQVLLISPEPIMDRYRQDCVTLGRQVRVISPTQTRQGVAEAVEQDGSLTVLFQDGRREQVSSGEVSVRGLWDYL